MKPRFVLTIEAAPQPDDADGTRRLRAALKRLWRNHGLRCLIVTTVQAASRGSEATGNQVTTAAIPEK